MQFADDIDLIAAIGSGRQDALSRAYQDHAGPVLAVATRVVRDRAMAEDVVQEVFTRLWRRPDRFDPERGTLRTFLLRDTHGRAVDLIRSETARKAREAREQIRSSTPPPDTEEQVWSTVISERVREALATLPDHEREPVELAYFGGLSYREAAERLGEPEGTVKSRIRSALKKLHGPLMQEGVVPT